MRRAEDEQPEPENETVGLGGDGQEVESLDPLAGGRSAGLYAGASPEARERAEGAARPGARAGGTQAAAREGQVDWQDRALRLQAEMENYRRRQRRLAQDQIEAERERLLNAFLEIVDDLERALAAPSRDGNRDGGSVRDGVQLTHRAALQRLKKEDVERIEAQGQRFDPAWHDAVSTVPGRQVGAAPETVVQVLEPGYRRGDRLLRPARVVVAV